MLDGLLGRGFSFKCKSVIKANRTRMEVVRKRAEAKQRFLKEDLAKLLSNGLDINAYGRTEEFLAGMNLLACYDFIEYSCEFIVKQLSRMQKQGECPEDCREAVASLMFAAARFSDLPELRDLRDTFQERYGNCLEVFVSQKFVEKLSSKAPAAEKKLQALQAIASEFSINWDSRGFEQRMAAPSVVAKVHIQKPDIEKQKPALLDEKNRGNIYGGGNALKRYESDLDASGRQGPTEYREKSLLKNGEASLHIPKADIAKQKPTLLDEKDRGNRYGRDNVLRRDGLDHHIAESQRPTEYREKPLLNIGENSLQGADGISFRGRHRQTSNNHSYRTEQGVTESKSERSGSKSLHGKMLDSAHVRYNGQSNGISNPGKVEGAESLFREKTGSAPNRAEHLGKTEKAVSAFDYSHPNNTVNSTRKRPEEESDKLRSCSNYALPPPYVKPKDNILPPPYTKPKEDKHRPSRGSTHGGSNLEGHSVGPSSCKTNEVKSSDRLLKEPYHSNHDEQSVGPAPYTKPKEDKHRPGRGSKYGGSDLEGHPFDPSSCKTNVVNGSDRVLKEPHHTNRDEQCVGPAKVKTYDLGEELDFQGEKFPLPKPRSIRRKHHKSSAGYEVEGNFEDGVVKRSSSSRRKDSSRKGMQILFDEDHHPRKDDEERMIEKLLIHYSKKPTSYDAEKVKKKMPGQMGSDVGEPSSYRSRDEHHEKYEVVPPPTRSVSLPHEQTASQEVKKVLNRVNTFQPDNQAKHVHPKLPDYDDLAARFAALKGR